MRDPDADPQFVALLAELRSTWGRVPADETEVEVVWPFLRASYGSGYVTALMEKRPS